MVVTTQTELFSEQEWIQLMEHLCLPPRQAQIVKHLVHGMSDKQIARELGISLPTVRTHMSRVFRRFDLSDRVELILHVFTCLREHCAAGN
jgi:DNA-binding NarL/FixJ family response regulator